MSTSSVTLPAPQRERLSARVRAIPRPKPELLVLLALALLLDLWALNRNGYANEYYSAAVRSMSTSWHAFLYGSFDASGVMTVDKPPLALWIQALSVRAFGFSSWSMLVPQALMGAATVGLVYDMTRRPFGRVAGFAGGLVLALTPIAVAISRHNNPDALLVLCATAAVWCLVRALEDHRTRWIVLAGVAAGLGFEAKMGAILPVVPGIVLAWLWIAPRGRAAALRQLIWGAVAAIVVGLAWPLLMWLTPAADRPWISGTNDNSIWSLIFGYNGLGRLLGQSGGPGGGGPGGGFGGGGGPFGGSPGALRLLNASLGGQAGWLLGFAVVGGAAIVYASRLRRADRRTGWIIAVGGAFLVTAVAFSTAKGIFHPYYTSALAPFTAALIGAGAVQMAGLGRAMRVFAPLAIAAGVVTEFAVLHHGSGGVGWVIPIVVIACAGAATLLAWGGDARLRGAAVAVALGALLIAPASWAVQTLGHATSGTFPAGGPASAAFGGGQGGPGGMRGAFRGGSGQGGQMGMMPPGGAQMGRQGFAGPPSGGTAGGPPSGQGFAGPPSGGAAGSQGFGPGAAGGGGMFGGNTGSLSTAVSYAKAHGGGTIAVSSQSGAASAILSSDAAVAGIGGFSGRESEVSAAWLAQEVQNGNIRWVLSGDGGLPMDSRVGSRNVMSAVTKACTAVSLSSGSGSSTVLYDCAGKAAALRAAG